MRRIEMLVLDAPYFRKRIELLEMEKVWYGAVAFLRCWMRELRGSEKITIELLLIRGRNLKIMWKPTVF
jgi:hypothetical protein